MAHAALIFGCMHYIVNVTFSYVLGNKVHSSGLHSLRSGGAAAAVNSRDGTVSDRLLKLHGRWKFDGARDLSSRRYIGKNICFI